MSSARTGDAVMNANAGRARKTNRSMARTPCEGRSRLRPSQGVRAMLRFVFLALPAFAFITASPVRADDIPAKYREVVNKGLTYLAKSQLNDGRWEANGGAYP